MRIPAAAAAACLSACLALLAPAVTAGATARPERIHPSFSLTARDLAALAAGLPGGVREAIAARPRDFLDGMKGVLQGPRDLLILVDKAHGLERGYTPPDLLPLSRYPLSTSKPDLRLRALLIPDLVRMSEAARAEGVTLVVSSAWRSSEYQEALFAAALSRQPREEVEKTLARPGHSQHQLGTAIDFGSIDVSFAETAAGRWLFARAAAWGFSLSYPRGLESVSGYSWEPWHYRYVGRPAAGLIDGFFAGSQQEFLEFCARSAEELLKRLGS